MGTKDLTINEILASAIQKHQKNDFNIAEVLYKKVLKKDPNNINANFLFAILSAQLQKLNTAEEFLKKVIKENPNYKNANYNLGLVYKQKGEHKKSIIFYEKEIQIQPNYLNAHNNLGIIFHELREFKKAKACYEKLIKIDENYLDGHFNLGKLFQDLEDHKGAINCYNKVIKINPNHVGAHINLGVVYEKLDDYKRSKFFYKKTIEINPNLAKGYYNLGNAYEGLGEFRKAIKFYEKAIEFKHDYVDAFNNLALVLKEIGEFKKAIECYEKAIKNNPDNLVLAYNLSELKKETLDFNLKKKIIKIIDENNCSSENASFGNFLLSKYELEEKNYNKEFNFLLNAHFHYSTSKKFFLTKEIDYWLNKMPNTKEFFNYKDFKKNIKKNDDEINPIFIVGVPRCGSTLIEKVIASSEKVIPIGEETNIIKNFIRPIVDKKEFKKIDINELRQKIIIKFENRGLIKKNTNNIFTEKSLDNFFYIALIKSMFPNAKVINCKRNPLSSIMSIFQTNLKDVPWGHNLEHVFNYLDIYYKTINVFNNLFPNFIYDLKYEDFVNNPQIESKKLLKFCNLPWNKKCLEFYKRTDITSKTASSLQIKKAIYKDSGKKYLPYKIFLNKYGNKYSWFN
jgi:tetratricopeptide (TPR) repeat protein